MTPESRERLRSQLMVDEGCVLHAYQDSEGYWTIGYGTLIDQRLGGGISTSEAALLLDNRVGPAVRDLRSKYPWFDGLDDVRQVVLSNMRFNLGPKRFAAFVLMLQAVAVGDYATASHEMLNSRWAAQVGARAIRLADQMRTGKLP